MLRCYEYVCTINSRHTHSIKEIVPPGCCVLMQQILHTKSWAARTRAPGLGWTSAGPTATPSGSTRVYRNYSSCLLGHTWYLVGREFVTSKPVTICRQLKKQHTPWNDRSNCHTNLMLANMSFEYIFRPHSLIFFLHLCFALYAGIFRSFVLPRACRSYMFPLSVHAFLMPGTAVAAFQI